MDSNHFYVYAYLDPRKSQDVDKHCLSFVPLYIGKGTRDRLMGHMAELNWYMKTKPSFQELRDKRSNLLKLNKLRRLVEDGLPPIIVKIYENLSDDDAYELEVELISFYGRSIDGGVLTNLTLGGDGRRDVLSAGPFNPFYGKTHTEEFKQKMSVLHKGKVISDAQRSAISLASKGHHKRHHTKEAIRAALVRLNLDDPLNPGCEMKRLARSKQWIVTSPCGEVFTVLSLRRFCEERKLPIKTMMSAKNRNSVVLSGIAAGWSAKLL